MDVVEQQDGLTHLVVAEVAGGDVMKGGHRWQDGIEAKGRDILWHKACKPGCE